MRAGTGWSRWSNLGGTLTSGPAAASWGPGRLDVFARGACNAVVAQVVHRQMVGMGVARWGAHGRTGEWHLRAPRSSDVFGRGTNNALWTRSYGVGGTGWSGWTSLGGTLTSSPSATVPDAGVVAVFVRGTDGRYFYRQRSAALVWSSGWLVADAALAFRGLGAWVDTLDYSALSPPDRGYRPASPSGAHPVSGDRAVRQRHRHPLPG